MTERKPLVLRLTPELLRKVDRLTRRSRKEMGGSWSRNDQICWMLTVYEAPNDELPPPGESSH